MIVAEVGVTAGVIEADVFTVVVIMVLVTTLVIPPLLDWRFNERRSAMAELVMLVLDDPDKTGEVLAAWLAVGISGATILDSSGLSHELGRAALRDDLPLFPSLEDLLGSFDGEALVVATEKITGFLDELNTGILFTIPVTLAWGLSRRQR